MKYFIIFGPPGAGKGTQSVLLSKKYKLTHISTGDMLRKEIESNSELGIQVKKTIEDGKLIDDETILEIIGKIINDKSPEIKGYILDGYPRTLPQAISLDKILNEKGDKIEAVISLEVDENVIYERIARRAQIEGRKDDTDRSIIENRIAQYHKKTEPLIAYYKERGRYYPVKGNTTVEDGFERICSVIDNLNK